MKFTGERYVPSEQGQIRLEHVHRYAEAVRLCQRKRVLDVACGEGYGSGMLAEKAESVLGIDISLEAIQHARQTYKQHRNLKFVLDDAAGFKVPNADFDMAVSFETVEHLDEEKQILFLKSVRHALREDGFLLISSPNKSIYNEFGTADTNPYHLREMDLAEFDALLKSFFPCVKYYKQQLGTGSLIAPLHESAEEIHIWRDDGTNCRPDFEPPIANPYYYLAVCAASEECLPSLGGSALYPSNRDLYLDTQLGAVSSYSQLVERSKLLQEMNEKLSAANVLLAQREALVSEQSQSLGLVTAEREEGKVRLDEAARLLNLRNEELSGLKDRMLELVTEHGRQQVRVTELDAQLLRHEAELNGQLNENKLLLEAGKEKEEHLAEMAALLSMKNEQLSEQDVLLGKIYSAFRNNGTRLGNALRLSSLLLKREEELSENRQRLDELSAEQRAREERIARYTDTLFDIQKEQSKKDTRVQVLDASVKEMRSVLESSKDELLRLQKEKTEKDTRVQKLGASVEEMRAVLENSKDEIARLQKEKDSRVRALDASVEDMRVVLESSKRELFRVREEIKNKEGHIEELLVRDRELEQIKSSRMWALMRSVWGVSRAILPYDSRRRLLFETGYMFARHPFRFLGRLSSTRVNLFFRTLRREGAAETLRRVKRVIARTALGAPKIQLQLATQEPVKTDDDAATWDVLTFPIFETPVVSIVIPAYNQFGYTYQCLGSILRNSGDVAYEVIVADDCSADKTRELDALAKNINVIHNKENLQFVRNCNNAAQQARGEFILFLNNDTQVQPDWLRPLVELMRKDPKIGMTGSKLVFPDGTLQEAGGIFWKDASAWNYGRGDDPVLPDYNYVRETDYITGAALMIRRELWNEIGGFDTRYVPAYCEDADLAFEIRKHGYKVVYQPESVVVHFEGKTHGTDVNSGIKAYQVTNQKKFFEKWRDVLEREHFPNGENVFLARGRSRGRKTILVVDHYVPQFDRDAGSRTVYNYIQLFRKMDVDVIFIPDNFHYDERYVRILQQMGVFVLYGNYYYNQWESWLKKNGENLHGIFLCRPHVAVKYIDPCRRFTKAKIVYYGVDLHFVRMQRCYELTGDKAAQIESEDWKKKEIYLLNKADISCYPSYVEVKMVEKIVPSSDCRAIPGYIYSDIKQKNFLNDRSDLLFVGGFRHPPNVDGLLWFVKEVMPLLKKKKPDIRLSVVGSGAPERIRDLNGNGVVFKGEVSDAELQDIYASTRISVAPLLYGAGVKGKVMEAMYHQVPLVTTSIGAEGLKGIERVVRVRDDAGSFAAAILELHDDYKLLKKMSKREYHYIMDNFNCDYAGKIIRDIFKI